MFASHRESRQMRQDRILPKEFLRSVEMPTKLTGSLAGHPWSERPRECDGMENNGARSIRVNRVRELRENRLMTQAQLARKAKVALRTIHSVEKGMNCRMDTKRKILLALGLRFEDKDQVFPPKYPAAEPPGVKPLY